MTSAIKYQILLIAIFLVFQQCQGCQIYLTISLEGKQWLQINWGPRCDQNGPEWIALYSQDPSIGKIKHDAIVYIGKNSSGTFITNIRIENIKFPGGWDKWNVAKGSSLVEKYPNGKCLNYYLGAFYKIPSTEDDYDMSVNCLKIQPTWMTMSDDIPKLPLKNLFIPGTHSSGAYTSGSVTRSILVKNFGFVQDFDVWSQLVFGIRYLNFKIGYRGNSSEGESFWIVNENMLINPLKPILNDVKQFLLISEEVVVMDFSEFPIGFSKEPKRHSQFLQFIRKEIGSLAFERNLILSDTTNSYDVTINEIRSSGKNLLILYPFDELTPADVKECNFIWPAWKRYTVGNLNTDETLDFMRLLFTKKESSPIQDEGWIFYGVKALEESYSPDRSLPTTKERAKIINFKLNNWLTGPWSLRANVVAVDYFTNTNLIDIAIQVNMHKGFTTVNKNLTKIEI